MPSTHSGPGSQLSPYGINRGIDSFSRKIICLRPAFTNTDPGVIADYHTLMCMNMATENMVLRDMEVYSLLFTFTLYSVLFLFLLYLKNK